MLRAIDDIPGPVLRIFDNTGTHMASECEPITGSGGGEVCNLPCYPPDNGIIITARFSSVRCTLTPGSQTL